MCYYVALQVFLINKSILENYSSMEPMPEKKSLETKFPFDMEVWLYTAEIRIF